MISNISTIETNISDLSSNVSNLDQTVNELDESLNEIETVYKIISNKMTSTVFEQTMKSKWINEATILAFDSSTDKYDVSGWEKSFEVFRTTVSDFSKKIDINIPISLRVDYKNENQNTLTGCTNRFIISMSECDFEVYKDGTLIKSGTCEFDRNLPKGFWVETPLSTNEINFDTFEAYMGNGSMNFKPDLAGDYVVNYIIRSYGNARLSSSSNFLDGPYLTGLYLKQFGPRVNTDITGTTHTLYSSSDSVGNNFSSSSYSLQDTNDIPATTQSVKEASIDLLKANKLLTNTPISSDDSNLVATTEFVKGFTDDFENRISKLETLLKNCSLNENTGNPDVFRIDCELRVDRDCEFKQDLEVNGKIDVDDKIRIKTSGNYSDYINHVGDIFDL